MKTSCCIDQDYILLVGFCMLDRCFRNVYRLLFVTHGKDFYALFLAVDLQLCDSCRTVNVTGHQKWFLSFGFQLACKLGNCGGLTCTLQTGHHIYCDLISRMHGQLCCLASHQVHKFVIYDFDHHLARIQSVHHVLSDCLLLYGFGKLLYDLEVNIGFQKSHLYFFQGKLYIFFCEASLTT